MKENDQEKDNPDEVINEMLELYSKVSNLDYSDEKDAKRKSKEISKEIDRLTRLQTQHLKKFSEENRKLKDSRKA